MWYRIDRLAARYGQDPDDVWDWGMEKVFRCEAAMRAESIAASGSGRRSLLGGANPAGRKGRRR